MQFMLCSLLRVFNCNLHFSSKLIDKPVKNKARHMIFPTSSTSCGYFRWPFQLKYEAEYVLVFVSVMRSPIQNKYILLDLFMPTNYSYLSKNQALRSFRGQQKCPEGKTFFQMKLRTLLWANWVS